MTEVLQLRVESRNHEAEGIVGLRLVPIDGRELPAFEAGAHVDLHLGDGLVRQYSLCRPHDGAAYELGVLLAADSRGGSRAVHALRPGDVVGVGTPRNLFPLAVDASHHVLLAGGIGLTPLLCMAESLHARGASFELHVSVRNDARLPFRARLQAAAWRDAVSIHVDGADGKPGHDFAAILGALRDGSHVYACGPAGYIAAAQAATAAAGIAPARFHSESFNATVDTGGDSFEVEINDGRVFVVEAGQSVAQCLEANGVFVPLSCEQGICGTCVTPVKSGVPDHRDQYLTDEERASNQLFTPCCSRSRSPRLVLDLDA